jgi:hypothetical protein
MLLRAPVICTVFIDIPCITVRKLFPLSQFLGYMFSHITYYTTDYIHEEESKTTILLHKALVEATKKLQRTIRTLRVTRNEIRYLERIKFSCFMNVIRRIGAPLLANLFLYSYEGDFIQGLLKKNEKRLARSFNFTFRYIDDVLLLNNSRFGDFVDRIYPIDNDTFKCCCKLYV